MTHIVVFLSLKGGFQATQGDPKAMPPIYFHGNYNRQKAYDNDVGYSKFSATKLPQLAAHFASDEQDPA
jgi:hypothetical protein